MATYEESMEAMRIMGQSTRFYQRMVARKVGLTEMPGTRVYIDGVEMVSKPEKLNEFLPGEQDWIAAYVLNEAFEKAGFSKP
jgi:hypothetical protein